jgi:hypothetical protein
MSSDCVIVVADANEAAAVVEMRPISRSAPVDVRPPRASR